MDYGIIQQFPTSEIYPHIDLEDEKFDNKFGIILNVGVQGESFQDSKIFFNELNSLIVENGQDLINVRITDISNKHNIRAEINDEKIANGKNVSPHYLKCCTIPIN